MSAIHAFTFNCTEAEAEKIYRLLRENEFEESGKGAKEFLLELSQMEDGDLEDENPLREKVTRAFQVLQDNPEVTAAIIKKGTQMGTLLKRFL